MHKPSSSLGEASLASDQLLQPFFSGKKVLVTGSKGFIGRALCLRLRRLGAFVVGVDLVAMPSCAGEMEGEFQADCSNQEFLARVLPGVEVVFNLAGRCGHLESMQDPLGDLAANLTAPLAVLVACRRWAPSAHLLYAGTRQIYGRVQRLPVAEDHPLAPLDANGIHKMAAEQHCLLFARHFGLCTTVLRLTNTYGPEMRRGGFGQTFLGEWFRRALCGEEIVVYGEGTQVRDLNYVDDVVEAFLRVAQAGRKTAGEVFNLGGREVSALWELAWKIAKFSGSKVGVRREPFPASLSQIDIGDYQGDFGKIRGAVGWEPVVGVEAGLRKTWEAMVAEVEAGRGRVYGR